jgi:hypothetical protein
MWSSECGTPEERKNADCQSPIVMHGVRAICAQPMGTRIDLPVFRDENGMWCRAITLSDEISGAVGKAVLDALVVTEGRLVRKGVS